MSIFLSLSCSLLASLLTYELEYRMIIVAVFALNVAHPGPVFPAQKKAGATVDSEGKTSGV